MTDEQARQLALLLMSDQAARGPAPAPPPSPFRRPHHQFMADALLAGAAGIKNLATETWNGLGVLGDIVNGRPRTMDDIRDGALGASALMAAGGLPMAGRASAAPAASQRWRQHVGPRHPKDVVYDFPPGVAGHVSDVRRKASAFTDETGPWTGHLAPDPEALVRGELTPLAFQRDRQLQRSQGVRAFPDLNADGLGFLLGAGPDDERRRSMTGAW